MKNLKPFILTLFLLSTFTALCQLEQLELQVLDLETSPAYEKTMNDVLVANNQVFIITRSNGIYDLIVNEGEEVVEIIKDSEEELRFMGAMDGGILMMIGWITTTQRFYFLDLADYSLTELYAFENGNHKATTFLDNNRVVFLDYQENVYTTNGTVAGTFMLQNFFDVPQSENLEFILNGSILFEADDQLWHTDGTLAGTYSFSNQVFGSTNDFFVESNGLAYYSIGDDLWVTDGTIAGTQIINDNTGYDFTNILYLVGTADGVAFIGRTLEFGDEIWSADGTPNGTQLVVDFVPGPDDGIGGLAQTNLRVVDNFFFLSGDGIAPSQVWITDGTAGGIQQLLDFSGQPNYSNVSTRGPFVTEDGKIFFSTRNDIDEGILWYYDANTSSAVQMTTFPELNSITAYSSGSKLFFEFYEDGDQLWVSDGTPNGTAHLTTTSSNLEFIGTHNDLFYYKDNGAGQGTVGFELYVSDGTVAGTQLLKDIYSGPIGSNPDFFFVFNDAAHFYAEDNTAGQSIYNTDGTEPGTDIVFDMYPNTSGSDIQHLTKGIGKLFFTIDDTLWVSDGTAENAQSLMMHYGSSSIRKLGEINGRLIFQNNWSVWTTDGTLAGTQQLIGSVDFYSISPSFTKMDGHFWFFYDDGNNGFELYKTDGTPNGTVMAFESAAGAESIFDLSNREINAYNGKLFFTNKTTSEGAELWCSDGTLNGSMIFMDFWSGNASSSPKGFVNFNDEMYFYTNTLTSTFLWKTNGTPGGTLELAETSIVPQKPIVEIQGSMMFFNQAGHLWKTDGSPEGSEMVHEFISAPSALHSGIIAYENNVVLQGNTLTDSELWISDGTSIGTVLLRDISDNNSSFPKYFTTIEGIVYFTARDSTGSFRTIYRTNGTEEGTYKATDLSPSELRDTENLISFRDRLYFIANTSTYGDEIYFYDLEIPEKISGEVYHDVNSNGVKDTNEPAVVNFPLLASANNGDDFYAYTDEEGKYKFYVASGTYQVSPVLNQCWAISSDSLSYQVDVENMIATDVDFGLSQASDESDVWNRTSSGPTRCGFTVSFWVDVVNTGCDSIGGEIQVEIDPLTEFVSSSQTPDAVVGNIYTWSFEDLSPSHNSKIRFDLIMPDQDFIGDSIHVDSDIYLLEGTDLIWADSHSYVSVINCAYDPNDKLVEPDRSGLSPENYSLFDEQFTYTIRFQNTGTDTAFTVTIRDVLSPLLDIGTFKPLAASHPFSTSIYPGRVVEFLFEDILLPDSSANEPESHGYVVFQINTIDALDEFDELQNTANIYFDFNEAIVTNTVTNTLVSTFDFDLDSYYIWDDCDDNNAEINPGAIEIANNDIDENCDELILIGDYGMDDLKIELFPNPSFESLNLILHELYDLELNLFDVNGKILLSKQVNESVEIDLNYLSTGVYFIKITNQATNHSIVKKIVKLNR